MTQPSLPDSRYLPTGRVSPWRPTRHGVGVVVGVELRRLLRSRAWLVALAIWAVIVTGLTVLLLGSFAVGGGDGGPAPLDQLGITLFAVVSFGVLALGALVAPALSATSVNAERRDGTLATWQATLLTPADIATGKLAAGWLAAVALVLGATPALVITYAVAPGMVIGRLVTTLLIVTLTLLVVVTIGLAMSATLQSPITSTVVTYLLVVALGLGGPILFGLTAAVVTSEVEVTDQIAVAYDPTTSVPEECRPETRTERLPRTDLTWPLLATSPFVMLADAAPRLRDVGDDQSGSRYDVLGGLSAAVRQARLGPQQGFDQCDQGAQQELSVLRDSLPPVWGWSMLFLLVIAVTSWVVAVRRLIVPVRRLPRGMRIA